MMETVFLKCAWVWAGAGLVLLLGCAAAPVDLQCREIRSRLSYENLSEDQRRFAEEELANCESQLGQAQALDSMRVNSLERKLSPDDSLP